MAPLGIVVAALALSLERLCYVFAWRKPAAFRSWSARLRIAADGVTALERLFVAFKFIQVGVFVAWWLVAADVAVATPVPTWAPWVGGLLLIGVGQSLNLAAFRRLGRVGVFYGRRFGHTVEHCSRFPYSVVDHPQYIGTVATIWGLFLIVRFPQPDWSILPTVETIYYFLGAILEDDRTVADRGSSLPPADLTIASGSAESE